MAGNVGRQTSLYSFKSGGSAAPSSVGVTPADAGLGGSSKLLSPQSSTLDRTVSKMSSLSHPTAGCGPQFAPGCLAQGQAKSLASAARWSHG